MAVTLLGLDGLCYPGVTLMQSIRKRMLRCIATRRVLMNHKDDASPGALRTAFPALGIAISALRYMPEFPLEHRDAAYLHWPQLRLMQAMRQRVNPATEEAWLAYKRAGDAACSFSADHLTSWHRPAW